jgi:peptide chain release factor subunit 1
VKAVREFKNTLDKLAAFEPVNLPVISLYLNTQSDQHGRDNFESFVRGEFKARAQTYRLRSPERVSFDKDTERINEYLKDIRPSANSVAIFACSGADDFFETLELDAPIEENRLYVYHQPHLYPLARIGDRYRRYAALIADTNAARIYVFGIGAKQEEEEVKNANVNKTQLGGWSQARYQRHIENYYLHHAKEVVDALDKVVKDENIEHVILAGDEVIIPILKEQFPHHLSEKVIDVLRIDMTTPEHEIARQTLEALHEYDAKTDAEEVENLLNQYRAGNLGVVGLHDTLAALSNGQVDELFVSTSLEEIYAGAEEVGKQLVNYLPEGEKADDETVKIKVADELITRARQTGAKIRFIEDTSLLADIGGVGATLRYRFD